MSNKPLDSIYLLLDAAMSHTIDEDERLALIQEALNRIENVDYDPHGHIVCVRPSDLEEYFGEDAQYFTQEMLEGLSDGMWQMDDDGWHAMFTDSLEALMQQDKAAWQKELDEEKKRRGIT